jgi:hypothetical protein
MHNTTTKQLTSARRRRQRSGNSPLSAIISQLRPWLEAMEDRTLLSVLVVTNTFDTGPGSLRQAILDADAAQDANTIDFAIIGSGLQTIDPASPLPAITDPLLIDGTSQSAYSGTPIVEIDGEGTGTGNGLTIFGSGSTIRGLAIDGFKFGAAISIDGAVATNNAIYGNELGVNIADPRSTGNLYGVEMVDGAQGNNIGSNNAGGPNAINGNTSTGVLLLSASVNASQGFGSAVDDLTLNGSARIEEGELQLTDGSDTETGGAFTSSPVDVSQFTTHFTFQLTNPVSGALDFTIQNQGPGATGMDSGSIKPSVSAVFDLDPPSYFSTYDNTTGLSINGTSDSFSTVNLAGTGIDLHSGDIVIADLSYADLGLSVTLTDADTGATATQVYSVDIPREVGASSAYVGFSASSPAVSGAGATAAAVSGWSFTSSAATANNVVAGNAITNNGGPGVSVAGPGASGNTIAANTIAGNAGLAIDTSQVAADTSPLPPAIIMSADGGWEGWLSGAMADASYTIDFFASAGYGPQGSGEAQDYLGSSNVMTDSQGDSSFDVPFVAPDNLPVMTATATDPIGNTSEVSGLRAASLVYPAAGFRLTAGQPLRFTGAGGATLRLADPEAGPLDTTWSVMLSVPGGELSFHPGAGSVGSQSVQVQGTLPVVDAVLSSLIFTPAAGFHGDTTLTVMAQSSGAVTIQTTITITDGVFVVTSLADSGPGSLRQAILDSNLTGEENTIAFALSGTGLLTIALATPLPEATTPTLIDGSTQPGFAGTPLVALAGQWPTAAGAVDVLGSSLSVRSISVDDYVFATDGLPATAQIESAPTLVSAGGYPYEQYSYPIVVAAEGLLVAGLEEKGLTARLSLSTPGGHVLVVSDGQALSDPGAIIDQHLSAGSYVLTVELLAGTGSYVLNTTVTPTSTAIALNDSTADMMLGDFNGDGIPDLAMLDGVHPGVGDGTFGAPLAALGLPAGDDYGPMLEGDFNDDGKLDLAVVDYTTNSILVLLGRGNGTFQANTIFVTATIGLGYSTSLVSGDFNGDGKLDLAYDDSNAADVVVLLGNGNGTFQPAKVTHIFGPYVDPGAMVTGDFNGDGKIDIAVADQDGGIDVLLGHGDGTFGSGAYLQPVVTTAQLDINALAVGDFNGDGKIDIAATAYDNLQIFLGNGDGSFSAPENIPTETVSPVIVGDFNGDGRADLVLWGETSSSTAFISLLAGNGDGTFQNPVNVSTQTGPVIVGGVIAGDLTANGKLDLIEATADPGGLLIFLGNGNNTFQNAGSVATSSQPGTIALGDFNGDGRTDMAVASAVTSYSSSGVNTTPGTLTILLGDGQGGFETGEQIALGQIPAVGTPVVGDFNGDGRLDLALIEIGPSGAARTLVILLGDGDGTFQPESYPIPSPDLPSGESDVVTTLLAAGDFNGDGRTDLVTIGGDGSPLVLLGNGDGTFTPQPADSGSGNLNPTALVVGDFNNDGNLDVAIDNGALQGVAVYLGNGDGGFSSAPSANITGRRLGDDLVAGDFNGDSKLDLATLSKNAQGLTAVSVFPGDGDGTFGAPITDFVAVAGSLVAGNFMGDGNLDVAVVGAKAIVLPGNGDGTFQLPDTVPISNTLAGPIEVGDLNGDGRPDLILFNVDGSITALLNSGNGTFSTAAELAINLQDTPLVVDTTGDGVDDVLVVDGAGDILYRQGNPQAPGSFLAPVTLNPGFPSRDIAWVPNTAEGPLLASVDVDDNRVSLYTLRDGVFVRVGSLATGALPAQIIAADLTDDGWDDLVVRNAGDGTLSVFLNNGLAAFSTSSFSPFQATVSLAVGQGISDLQAIDLTGTGLPDLIFTNAATGQVTVLPNLGNGNFAVPVPYRAGVSPVAIDNSSGASLVTSQEATVGVSSASFTAGAPISLIAADPGTHTLDALAGLGGGNLANPVVLQGPIEASVIRTADLNGDGFSDVVVLDTDEVSVFLGNGKGGLLPPVTYNAGPDPTGLTVVDVNGDGKPDLLIGDPFGDVLVLLNQGNGTFAPYRNADQSITLAVADLTGNGSKDVIYADQSLDRVVVDYGAGSSSVLGDRSSGLLSPGAVKLADLNGDGIPDLIVANSGSNNVLVYPGLGNGQFGSAVNNGHGFFTGTNPTGLYVADVNGDGIPDLLVANSGSNDVSVLIGQGTGASWTMVAGPRIKTDAGPVAVAVGDFLGANQLDLAVANKQANNVEVFPSVGSGFFNDTKPVTYPVGQAPSGLFMGNFTGSGTSIATLNSGSDTISLIGSDGLTQTISAGGLRPVSGFAGDFSNNGFTDLVVGDNGNGTFALFTGGVGALSLSQTITSDDAPSPTSLSFAGVTDGVLSFYASTEGRETATLLAFNLDEGSSTGTSVTGEAGGGSGQSSGGVLASATAGMFQQVAQLLGRSGSPFDLVAPLFTVSVIGGEFNVESSGEGGLALLAGFAPAAGPGAPGQSLGKRDDDDAESEAVNLAAGDPAPQAATDHAPALPLWKTMAMGLERAWEQVRSELLKREGIDPGAADRAGSPPGPAMPPASAPERSSDNSSSERGLSSGSTRGKGAVTEMAIDELMAEREHVAQARPGQGEEWLGSVAIEARRSPRLTAAAIAVMGGATIGRYVTITRFGPSRRRNRASAARMIR